jgi:hypothetical protein
MMLKKDEAKRVAVNQERNLIIGQMLEEKNKGMNTQEPKKKLRLNTTVIPWKINKRTH